MLARTTLAGVLFAALFAVSDFAQSKRPTEIAAQQNVSGIWSGSFDIALPDGGVQHETAFLILKQEGSVVSGSVGQSEDKQSQIKDGKADEYGIQFIIESHGGMPMIFHLHLEGGHLKGNASGQMPGGQIIAKVDALPASSRGSQTPSASPELFKEISALDGVLFAAFNRRDLATLKSMFTEDLEFYHDRGGLTLYQQNIDSFKKTFESSTTVRRELVADTLEVYPIKGYGAVEIGVHRFYSKEPGQEEKLTATAKFVHVWQKKNGQWKISRVVSYDHR